MLQLFVGFHVFIWEIKNRLDIKCQQEITSLNIKQRFDFLKVKIVFLSIEIQVNIFSYSQVTRNIPLNDEFREQKMERSLHICFHSMPLKTIKPILITDNYVNN